MLKSVTGSIVPSPSGLASDSLNSSCSALMVVFPGKSFLWRDNETQNKGKREIPFYGFRVRVNR